jgi:hypothetical protein
MEQARWTGSEYGYPCATRSDGTASAQFTRDCGSFTVHADVEVRSERDTTIEPDVVDIGLRTDYVGDNPQPAFATTCRQPDQATSQHSPGLRDPRRAVRRRTPPRLSNPVDPDQGDSGSSRYLEGKPPARAVPAAHRAMLG